jgi:hypothetical protein
VGSLRRIGLAVLAVAACAAAAFWLFEGPVGVAVTDGRHDRGRNAIWIGHGWLGDDGWFDRQKRRGDIPKFRDPARIAELAERLARHHLTDVYPHLCPAAETGALPPVDPAQVNRFLAAFPPPSRVMPWVGGNRYKTARLARPEWRGRFAADCADLLVRHPKLAGVHLNIEPCASGSEDLLALLDALRRALPAGKLLSLSAYPPPTSLQPAGEVHWDEPYVRAVARRVDQIAFMMYDSWAQHSWTYQRQMRRWTRETLAWCAPTPVLFGVPAYDDAWAPYHRPDVENVENALLGIHAGLLGEVPAHYQGVAVYCEWEMNDARWRTLRELFVRPPRL